MLVIKLKDGENIERALKRFKRKFNETKVMRELRERDHFTKPSMKKRVQKKKAIYIQNLRNEEGLD